MTKKSLLVWGWPGRPRGWYARVEDYGILPVLHWHCLTGAMYRQDCRTSLPDVKEWKAEQAAALKKHGLVIITYDDVRRKPWKRVSYVGLFSICDIRYDDYVLTFRLVQQLANLYRPSEAAASRSRRGVKPIIIRKWG
jgi:hypothetical protein